MTHLHLPDGALPWWLWLPGAVIAVIILIWVSRRHQAAGADRLALLGTMSAFMLAAMALPLGPLGYHLSLAPVVGILLGSGLAFISAAIVNLILALLGHGGLTVMGLNALVLGTAAALGRRIYLLLESRFSPFWAAAVAAALAQVGSLMVFLVIVGVSGLTENPADIHRAESHVPGLGSLASSREVWSRLGRFAALSLPFWVIGMVAESFVAGGIIGFLKRVSPGLIPNRGSRSKESTE